MLQLRHGNFYSSIGRSRNLRAGEIARSMRKLICELTKGIGLSSAASRRVRTITLRRLLPKSRCPHRYSILPRIPGQCPRDSNTTMPRLVHDRFNYMTREARGPSFFIVHPLWRILSKRSFALDKQCPFFCAQ